MVGFVCLLLPKLDQFVSVFGSSWESQIEKLIRGFLVFPPFNFHSLDILLGDFGADVGNHFIPTSNSSDDASPSPMEVAADPVDVSSLVHEGMASLVVRVFAAAVAGAAVVLAEGTAADIAAIAELIAGV